MKSKLPLFLITVTLAAIAFVGVAVGAGLLDFNTAASGMLVANLTAVELGALTKAVETSFKAMGGRLTEMEQKLAGRPPSAGVNGDPGRELAELIVKSDGCKA